MSRLAIDTNILVYSEGVERSRDDGAKIARCRRLLEALASSGDPIVVPAQVFAELYDVLVRKAALDASEAHRRLKRLQPITRLVPTDEAVLQAALNLAETHKLRIYDAIIVAAAIEAQCALLVSEDLQEGFTWRGLVVVNPFSADADKRIEKLLR